MQYKKLSKKQFEKLLTEKFPLMYKDMYGDPQSTCMAFGLDGISIGWFDIIYNMSEKLEAIAASQSEDSRIKFAQIKEKFGTLRVYLNSSPEETDEAIKNAEELSSKTCIDCGDPGVLVKNGWLVTLCKTHRTMSKHKKIMDNCEYAWKHELKDYHAVLITQIGYETDSSFGESFINSQWQDLPEDIKYVLVAKMKFLLEELDVQK